MIIINLTLLHSFHSLTFPIGKTMRNALLSEFPKRGINEVSAIMLTHDHADAILGLDDVRDLQAYSIVDIPHPTTGEMVKGTKINAGKLPIYLHKETFDTVKRSFAYLTNPPEYLDEAQNILVRRIAFLDFVVIDVNSHFNIHGLKVRSFPVYHGGTYVSLGFSFGEEGEFIYISDVKIIPDETMAYLKSIPKIKVLVIDCLVPGIGILPHMGLDEALAAIEILRPERAYLVGMCCAMGLHDEADAMVQERSPITSLAYDGMVLEGFRM